MPEETSTLLQTKLHRPRASGDRILRPRLLDQLDEGIHRWLTLVCAPAGFGKTTLVSLWIDSISSKPDPLPVAWLSLDQDDSDIVQFIQYWIAALRTVFPGACPETLQLFAGIQLPPLKLVFATLSNEIMHLPQRCVLVLDDYQMIQGDTVPELLNELLQHWPETLHLILITRSNPPLPLTRLRANGLLTEIRSKDLRFDRDETAAFLEKAHISSLNEHAVDAINERTEGWIGALRLASLSLRSAANVQDRILSMAGSDENIADYLANEVLARQLPVIQKFLLKTSILDRFCAPLCEAVIEELDPAWDVQACINWLVREELFVISLDENQCWYRYHHLFMDLLKNRASLELGAEQVADLHRRAAGWFAQQRMPDQALHHCLEAGDLALATQLATLSIGDMLNREDRLAFERWLRMLPEMYIEKRPELLIIKAWVFQYSFQWDAQEKVIAQIEALLNDNNETPISSGDLGFLRAQIAVMKAQSAYFKIQPDLALAYCQEALEVLPESWTYLRGAAMLFLGLSLHIKGEGQTATRLLLEQYETLNDKANGFALRILQSLCFIFIYTADFELAYQTAQVLLSKAEARGLLIMHGWAHFFLGAVLYHWNDLEAAADHFTWLADHCYTIQALSAREGIIGMALIHQIQGKQAQAFEMVDLLSQIDLERMGAEADSTRSLRARLNLLAGDLEAAKRWADGFIAQPTHQLRFWLETPHLSQVRVLLALRQSDDLVRAHQILDALADSADRTHNKHAKIEILNLRAMALNAQGKTADSLAVLGQAVDLARQGGILRVFLDLGPGMQKMLVELARSGQSVVAVQRILDAFPDDKLIKETGDAPTYSTHLSFPGKPAPLVEPLTTREREILLYMCEPTSLKDIAVKLSVSYGTVKRHTINIYGKLGVNSRWEAVTRATELGFLSTR